jgi:long-subunit acyl-CoA synthetase (AMP-forming)
MKRLLATLTPSVGRQAVLTGYALCPAGEYVAPERIEGTLKKASVVQQVFVHGNSFESCVVAVVVPNEKALRYRPLSPAFWVSPCGQALPESQLHRPATVRG